MKLKDIPARLNWATLSWTSPPGCYLACHGKTDGAGAQVQAVMSAMVFARRFGFKYVHIPFETIEHAPDGDKARWAHAWEAAMNLGEGELGLGDLPGVQVRAVKNCMRIRKVSATVQVVKHCNQYADLFPEDYETMLPVFRERYAKARPAQFSARPGGPLRVAVHVRRGDVTSGDAERYTSNARLAHFMREVKSALDALNKTYEFELYSTGTPSDFAELHAFTPAWHLDEDAIDTFHRLVGADILLTAKSSFSYVAALLNEGVKLHEPFWHSPQRDWIPVMDGGFDREDFRRQLDRHMARYRTA